MAARVPKHYYYGKLQLALYIAKPRIDHNYWPHYARNYYFLLQDVCHRHADLKQHLQDKVSQCQNALPLWLSFAATSTDLTSWMKRIEKLLPSPPMLPSLNSDEMNEMVVRIKSVQSELVHGKMRLQQLQSLEGMPLCVCAYTVHCAWTRTFDSIF